MPEFSGILFCLPDMGSSFLMVQKKMGDTSIFFLNLLCSLLIFVHLTYAPVGTGETYFAAFAALNLLVNLETLLEAAFFEIVFFDAACLSFFSASLSFS